MICSFSLPRTGLNDLVFYGEMIAQSNGRGHEERAHGRQHDLAIYRTANGDWVVFVKYRGIRPDAIRNDAAIVPDWEAIETALSRYPITDLIETEITDVSSFQRRRLLGDVINRFDEQVEELLKLVQHAVQIGAGEDKV